MRAQTLCLKCGAPLAGNTPIGFCPRCLFHQAALDDPEANAGFDPVERLAVDPLPADDNSAHRLETGPVSAEAEMPPARRFGDYELLEEIARGGMGIVYRARQTSLDRVVAVKTLLFGALSSPEFVHRLRTEASAAASLRHPNIVAIHEVGVHQNQHYFAMEYVAGRSLADWISDPKFQITDYPRTARWMQTIAEAIHYAHENGILHRDIKPSNVLIDEAGEPRITDFGLAKRLEVDWQVTVTGQVLGSPNYMAPEQALGKRARLDRRSDVYALGALLYHLLTRRPPHLGETLADTLHLVQNAEPVPPRMLNPSVPIDLQTICLKCLRKERDRRYSTARALGDDLGRFLRREPIQARPTGLPARLWSWCRRRPVVAALLLALHITFAAGIAGVLWQWQRAETNAHHTRVNLYAADVSAASLAIQRGDLGFARQLLAAYAGGEQPDLRGFEWRYLWAQCQGQQLRSAPGHQWIITSVRFSPDGQWIASSAQDPTVRGWRLPDLIPAWTFHADPDAVWQTQFLPGGEQIMTAGSDGWVRFWSLNTSQELQRFPGSAAAVAASRSVIAISDSSPMHWEEAGAITLWNYQSREKIRTLPEPGKAPAFSPQGDLLALAGQNGGIKIWDWQSGLLKQTLDTAAPVWSIAFSPNGEFLAAAGRNLVLLWNLRTGAPPISLPGHYLTVWEVTFSPDSTLLASACSDRQIRVWKTGTGELHTTLRGHADEVWSLSFSPDGRFLASGGKDCSVMLWDIQPAPRGRLFPHTAWAAPLLAANGSLLATLNQSNPAVRSELWDLKTGDRIGALTEAALAISPDGDAVITLDHTKGALNTWDPGTQRIVRSVELDGFPTNAPPEKAAYNFAHGLLLTDHQDGIARVWRRDGVKLGEIQGPKPPIRAVRISHSGRYIVIAPENEKPALLWDLHRKSSQRVAGHSAFVSGIAFSPDDTLLTTGSMDAHIGLWNPATGVKLASFPGHMEEVTDVAFSPDGQTLASIAAKDGIKLWHLESRRELMSLHIPDAGAFLAFSPKGESLFYTSQQGYTAFLSAPRPGSNADETRGRDGNANER